jgi:hypothetical protein
MIIVSERVRFLTAGAVISAKKTREWNNDYLVKESFEEDLKGCWKRNVFLEEHH